LIPAVAAALAKQVPVLVEAATKATSIVEIGKAPKLFSAVFRLIRVLTMTTPTLVLRSTIPATLAQLEKKASHLYQRQGAGLPQELRQLIETSKCVSRSAAAAAADVDEAKQRKEAAAKASSMAAAKASAPGHAPADYGGVGTAAAGYQFSSNSGSVSSSVGSDDSGSDSDSDSDSEDDDDELDVFREADFAADHHYINEIAMQGPASAKAINHVMREYADFAGLTRETLPGIKFVVDSEHASLFKVLIEGPEGTPFEMGLFEFSGFIPPDYPNSPPRLHLETTGSGKARFSPNLYTNGKVCLSLLGTWEGSADEQWQPGKSTILQVLISIQGMIFTERQVDNEPGFTDVAGFKSESVERGYSMCVRLLTLKHAVLRQFEAAAAGCAAGAGAPAGASGASGAAGAAGVAGVAGAGSSAVPCFAAAIKQHFHEKRDGILAMIAKELVHLEANPISPGAFGGLTAAHHPELATKYAKDTQRLSQDLSGFADALTQLELLD